MKNPWEEIPLSDYENHMGLPSVCQLQVLDRMMYGQLYEYPVSTAMILGVAGGNGLHHVRPERLRKVYGVEINAGYLDVCTARCRELGETFCPICADLTDPALRLPRVDLVIADLLIEYIGCPCFAENIRKIAPQYVSAVIQINTDEGFVSDSPYLSAFDGLGRIHHQMEEAGLTRTMDGIGYQRIRTEEESLPNGKKLVRLDYRRRGE